MFDIKRGELYYADLSPVIGSEQGGVRPVLVVQNDVGNKYSPTVIVAAITSQINKAKIPTHIELGTSHGLTKDSVLLLEQIRTLDKRRLKEHMGRLDDRLMQLVDDAIAVSFGINGGQRVSSVPEHADSFREPVTTLQPAASVAETNPTAASVAETNPTASSVVGINPTAASAIPGAL